MRGTVFDCNMIPITNNSKRIIAAVLPTERAKTALKNTLEGQKLDEVLLTLEKGKPILCEVPEFINCDGIVCTENYKTEDDIPVYSRLAVKDSMTTKELKFADYTAAYLQVYGKLTADAIYVVGKTEAVIGKYEGGSIQVKGTTCTLEDGSKVTDSVFFDEVLLYEEREDGEQVVTGVEKTETIIIELESTGNQDVPAGTKVITGKYLDPDDWTAYSYWFGGGNYRSLYQSGTDLYLGGVL